MGAPPPWSLDQPMGASWRLDQPMGASSWQLDQSVVSGRCLIYCVLQENNQDHQVLEGNADRWQVVGYGETDEG